MPAAKKLFNKIAIIGIGHIGASIALGARKRKLAGRIAAGDQNPAHVTLALQEKIADEGTTKLAGAVKNADLVILCVPVASMGEAAKKVAPFMKKGAILSDSGSVKQSVVKQVQGALKGRSIHFVPAHPIAGTEHSGPKAGLADLFEGRWCILTPLKTGGDYGRAVQKVEKFWKGLGAVTARMAPEHHDMVLALTSHLPHLIAYTIVSTATDMGGKLKSEVIRYSASGFRDFTRIASSDPVMWRDIFLNNKEAVLLNLQRFSEDLSELQKAIYWDNGEKLEKLFTRSRAIRRQVVEQNKAGDTKATPRTRKA